MLKYSILLIPLVAIGGLAYAYKEDILSYYYYEYFDPTYDKGWSCESKLRQRIDGFKGTIANNYNRIWPLPNDDIDARKAIISEAEENVTGCMSLAIRARKISEQSVNDWESREQARMARWTDQVEDSGQDIGDFVLNGIVIRIPRYYLWFGRYQPDGAKKDLNIMFSYPEQRETPDTPTLGRAKIAVLLQVTRRKQICFDNGDWCLTPAQLPFQGNVLRCYDVGTRRDMPKELCTTNGHAPEWNEEMGMYTTINHSFRNWVFFDGSIAAPDYWIQCKPSKQPQCYSTIMIGDRLKAKYQFDKRYLKQHREIHSFVMEKLNEFIDGRLD